MPLPNSLQVVLAEDWQAGGFAIYLHWPFCQAKCPYCDFNSYVARTVDHARWRRAFLSEIDRYAALTKGRVLTSVFFGGGTPSLMEPETVSAVIDRIRHHWPVANDLEITLEANPGSVEAGRFSAFAQAGVNRVSIGIQALNDQDLARLGRTHTVAEAQTAFDIARKQFERVSFDLIYARQHQTVGDWRQELTRALGMAVDHLSVYQLTIENGTAFGDRYKAGKLRGLPVDEVAADMYEVTQDLCSAAGLDAYEISNHARSGAESRHNRVYWRYGDYIGIGPGAHGRLTLGGSRYATEHARNPAQWLNAVDTGTAETVRNRIAPSEQADEFLMMGLRLVEGVDLDRYEALSRQPLPADALTYLLDIGMIDLSGRRLTVTPAGRIVLNAVLARLMKG